MDIILLPGNSVLNKNWIDTISNEFKKHFENVFTLHYRHWTEKQTTINIPYELKKLKNSIKEFKEPVIFAKSIGCLVTLHAIKQSIINPKKLIFVGLPINIIESDQNKEIIMKILKRFQLQTIIIQKEYDPAGHLKTIKEFLKRNSLNIKTIKYESLNEPNYNHQYDNINILIQYSLKDL